MNDDFLEIFADLETTPRAPQQPRQWQQRTINETIEDCECPECNAPMVMRMNRRNGEQFAGCSNYPRCRGTRQVRSGEVVNEDRPRRATDKERIRELEQKVDELEDKIAEIMHYYQGEAA